MPTIVLVDDDADDLFMTKRLLQLAGVRHPILALSSAEDAMRQFQQPGGTAPVPCLMFVDIKMPQIDGFEFLAWARQRPLFAAVKIYILSGSDEPRDRRRAAELGADGYLVKHPSLPVFREILAKLTPAP